MPDVVIASIIACLIGFVIGITVWYNYGESKCKQHQFEKIVDTVSANGKKDIVVYMCMKCGKRKITKV